MLVNPCASGGLEELDELPALPRLTRAGVRCDELRARATSALYPLLLGGAEESEEESSPSEGGDRLSRGGDDRAGRACAAVRDPVRAPCARAEAGCTRAPAAPAPAAPEECGAGPVSSSSCSISVPREVLADAWGAAAGGRVRPAAARSSLVRQRPGAPPPAAFEECCARGPFFPLSPSSSSWLSLCADAPRRVAARDDVPPPRPASCPLPRGGCPPPAAATAAAGGAEEDEEEGGEEAAG